MTPEKAVRRLSRDYYTLASVLRGEYVPAQTLESMQQLFSRVGQEASTSRKTRESYQLAARWLGSRVDGRS